MMNIPTTFWAVDRILQGLDAEAWAVDGMAPQAVLFPESVEEVVDVVRSASAAGLAIVPANRTSGARTGNRPRRCNLIVSLTRMNRVLEYEPADLTARVEAGCSLSDFHSETRRHGQWLPLDPPEAATATIGGLAATDDPGPLRTGYGPTRDYVIGMEAVLADGTLVHSGGRVVKNVAGFDLNKLFIGSYGTLGIVTRLFVKLRPEPEFETTLRMSCRSNSEVIDLARQIMQLEVLPAALEISAAAEGTRVIPASDSSFMPGSGGYLLSVRLIDSLAAIGEQADRILATARSSNARFDRMDGEESALFWRRWNEMLAGSAGSLRLRISTLPSRSSQLFRWGEEQLLRIAKQAVLTLAPATGTIRAVTHPPIDGEEEARIAGLVSTWRAEAEALAGYLTVESAAVGVKALVDSWGEVGLQFELMKRIKSKFDPRATFSPGRFLGGL